MVHQDIGPKDIVAILRRRYFLIAILAVIGGLAGFGLSRTLPKKYTSRSLVLVMQPTIQVVPSVITDSVNQRLASMQQQILSRSDLEPLIRDYHLYSEDIGRVPMEDQVDRLRQAITISAVAPMQDTHAENLPGFTISVVFTNAQLAQRICSTITDKFVKGNEQYGIEAANRTEAFLDQQVQDAKSKLDEQDAKVAAFQRRNLGILPEDSQNNLNLLNGQTAQLEAATQALNRAEQDKSFAESMLAQQLSSWEASQTGQTPESLDQQLQALQAQLATLQSKYTDDHPDVVKAKHDIAVLKQKIADSERTQKAAAPEKNQRPSTEPTQILQLRAQIHQYDQIIKERLAQQEEIKRQIAVYQSRVQASPAVEQEYKLLTRDRQVALDSYNDLLKKRDASVITQHVEESKQSERFQVLDPADYPASPSFPKKSIFAGGGLAAGLALGLGITLLLELQDTSMRTEHDVEVVLRLPVLAMIPVIELSASRERHMPSMITSYKSKESAKS
jgi:polysaccharide chain length determinant protein (PEP-CTERM system associated)